MVVVSLVLSRVQGDVMTHSKEVELNGNVTLRCILTGTHRVVQVSWQKQTDGNFENIAVNQESKDINVLGPYKHQLSFTAFALNDTAITFWKVSTKESGCYRCIFHTFPPPDFTETPCLSVYSSLTTFMHYTIFDGHVNATCFATGFPRPNITWVTSPDEMNEKEITNTNGTVSVMSSICVKTSSSKYAQDQICKVTHRGKEKFFNVPVKEKGRWNPIPVVLTVLTVIVVIVIIVVVCWRRHRKKQRGF